MEREPSTIQLMTFISRKSNGARLGICFRLSKEKVQRNRHHNVIHNDNHSHCSLNILNTHRVFTSNAAFITTYLRSVVRALLACTYRPHKQLFEVCLAFNRRNGMQIYQFFLDLPETSWKPTWLRAEHSILGSR